MELHGIHHLTAVSASIRKKLRYYFRNLYFREPGRILFERVALPPFLETHRESIVANLKAID